MLRHHDPASEQANECLHTRRKVLDYALMVVTPPVLAYALLGQRKLSHRIPSQFNAASLPVRDRPVDVTYFSIAPRMFVDDGVLDELHQALLPDPSFLSLPIGWVYHALRLWGDRATFSKVDFALPGLKGHWGREMVRFLTDNEFYSSRCMEHGKGLFEPSDYGLKVRTTMDTGLLSKWSSTHPGKYMQVMAELGQKSDTPIIIRNASRRYTIADIVRDDAMRVHPSIEAEWVAIGLSRYLLSRRWTNRFGQESSFDHISTWLIDRPFGAGACFGCHVPFARGILAQVNDRHKILSKDVAERLQTRLHEYAARLTRTQKTDGGWDQYWWDSTPSRKGRSPLWKSDDWDRLAVTGHHLEWMALLPDSVRPQSAVIAAACQYTVSTLLQLRHEISWDWQLYLPASHALKALLTLHGREFATFSSG